MNQANISDIIPQSEIEDFLLQLCSENPDVVFIVDDQRLAARRSILSEKSEFFRALLLGVFPESKQNEIKLNAPLEQFKILLFYIYTGRLPSLNLDESIEMLAIATEYIVPELISIISDQLVMALNMDNVIQMLKAAYLYSVDNLWQVALNLVDYKARAFLSHESFNSLPSNVLQKVIQRDSFSCDEWIILLAVLEWRKQNSNEDFEPILDKIRFILMSTNELFIVKAMNLFTTEKLHNILTEWRTTQNRPYRYTTLPDINIASKNYNARIIHGSDPNAMKDGSFGFTSCKIVSEAIVLVLGGVYVLNCIKFRFWDQGSRALSYYIESSLDQKKWERIIDYSNYLCRSWQNLYFKTRPIRFLRFVGTQNTTERTFHIIDVRAMYSEEMPKLIEDVCVPTESLADFDAPYTFAEDYYIVVLKQPYFIGSMRILFEYPAKVAYKYYVETSVNNIDWIMAIDKRDGDSSPNQLLKFESRTVIFVRVKFTENTQFDSMRFELPAQE